VPRTASEPKRTAKARFNSLEILRDERSPNALYVATEKEIEAGANDRWVSKASGLPILQQVVSRPVVFPDSVCDEGYEKLIRAGPVEVFSADNQSGALFPTTRGV
jgi:hypothetical protein